MTTKKFPLNEPTVKGLLSATCNLKWGVSNKLSVFAEDIEQELVESPTSVSNGVNIVASAAVCELGSADAFCGAPIFINKTAYAPQVYIDIFFKKSDTVILQLDVDAAKRLVSDIRAQIKRVEAAQKCWMFWKGAAMSKSAVINPNVYTLLAAKGMLSPEELSKLVPSDYYRIEV